MNYSLLRTNFTFKIISVALLFTCIDPGISNAQEATNEVSKQAQLEALTDSLETIAEAINTATDITPEKKLSFFKQLIQLSSAILVLRQGTNLYTPPSEEVEDTLVTPAEMGLYVIEGQLDLDAETVRVTEYYVDDVEDAKEEAVYDIEFEEVSYAIAVKYPDEELLFEEKVDIARSQIVDRIVRSGKITDREELTDLVFMSARNPIRDTEAIERGSSEARQLFRNFGKTSIIESLTITTVPGTASIVITDDQNSEMVIEMKKTTTEDRGRITVDLDEPEYVYTLNFYSESIGFGARTPDSDPEDQDLKISQRNDELTEEELIEYLERLAKQLPFADEIEDVETALLSYLLDNQAKFVYSESKKTAYPVDVREQCIKASDRVVLDEFLRQLSLGLGLQIIPKPDIFSYNVRVDSVRSSVDATCKQVKSYF